MSGGNAYITAVDKDGKATRLKERISVGDPSSESTWHSFIPIWRRVLDVNKHWAFKISFTFNAGFHSGGATLVPGAHMVQGHSMYSGIVYSLTVAREVGRQKLFESKS